NGKIDRKSLPLPTEREQREEQYIEPATEMEKKLAELWQEVLGIDRVGALDNFFHLGGHSLKAIALTSKILKTLKIRITLDVWFNHPTIRSMAEKMEAMKGDVMPLLEKANPKESYIASSAQKRMYMLDKLFPNSTAYHVPLIYILKGNVDIERLQAALFKLTNRHGSLRTGFRMNESDESIKQYLLPSTTIKINSYTLSEHELKPFIRKFIRPFKLDKPPLLRAALIKDRDNHQHFLVMDIHHMITDGISMDVLARDLLDLYENRKMDSIPLEYTDYSEWQHNSMQTSEMKKQEAYWLDIFRNPLQDLKLPYDQPGALITDGPADTIQLDIEAALVRKLKLTAAESGMTLFMLLFAVFNVLLGKLSGQDDIVIGIPVSGRNDDRLEKVVGLFVNTLAIRSFPKRNLSFAAFLQQVKQNLLNAYRNQDYPLDKLIEQIPVKRKDAHSPLFMVLFQLAETENEEIRGTELAFEPYPFEDVTSKFDLYLHAAHDGEKVSLQFIYSSARFNRNTVQSAAEDYAKILQNITRDSGTQLKEM
ncbi:condensation domain-containing protein, partial [Paenibacillus sp.]|uniref:condensation domain-containing protein n=1 Tax=Paenibacillus sp. TaxID=58172 RepID=UPI0028282053